MRFYISIFAKCLLYITTWTKSAAATTLTKKKRRAQFSLCIYDVIVYSSSRLKARNEKKIFLFRIGGKKLTGMECKQIEIWRITFTSRWDFYVQFVLFWENIKLKNWRNKILSDFLFQIEQ